MPINLNENSNSKFTLPAKYYTDEKYFTEEIKKIFFDQWICAGREEQIATPGQFFTREILGENVILTRDESHQPRAFFNVCRHRGTRICDKESGNFKGRISCPYHAWTYGLNGELVGAPHMSDNEDFSMKDYPLHSIQCDTWDGNIWINLSSKAPSLKSSLGKIYPKFQAWEPEKLKLGKRIHYTVKANWKLIIQNYSECLHCPVIHPTLKKLSHYMSGENEPLSPEFSGGKMSLNDGIASMTVSGKTDRKIFEKLNEEQKRHVYYYWVNPNLLLSYHPDFLMTHTMWPKSPSLTEIICEFHFHPDELKKPGFSAEDAAIFWDEVNREDWYVSELSQVGISSMSYTPGPYSSREGLLYGIDQILTQQVGQVSL